MRYRLLEEFRGLFDGQRYLHRRATLGDWVALHLYEDLVTLNRSKKFVDRVESGQRVLHGKNTIQGVKARRGDGTLGEPLPGQAPVFDRGYRVARGPIATVEIGVEVKIIAKAMLKQIDRVCGDLLRQANEFGRSGGSPIAVAIVGINHAAKYVGFEGSRSFPTTGSSGFLHPMQEARKAEVHLREKVQPNVEHFLMLRFRATNVAPYTFEWVDEEQTSKDYGAMLVRVSAAYERRF
ncbi:MAG TPA: hypothetical protein VLU25_12500 [Acidobacteriota bacterium]|nr:hypothetical protein [Acidobacteriota bacterium]